MNGRRPASIVMRAAWLVLLVLALAALAQSSSIHAWLIEVFELARVQIGTHPVAGAVVFVLLAGLSAMMAFFSSSVLVAPAVYTWGPTVTVALLWVGWMLGGMASYTLARWVGRPALRYLIRGRSLARLEARLGPGTPFPVVFLVQLALPSEIPGALLGIVGHPIGPYLGALALAELPWAVGTVLLGESFVQRRVGALIALGAAAGLLVLLVARLVRRYLPELRAGRPGER